MLLGTVAMMASCLNSSDDATQYGDAAISSFSIGTLTRTVHTLSKAGLDSTYKATVSGSSYDFEIDQTSHRIYNPDSLPVGTDISRVLVELSTYNNGTAFIRDIESEDILYLYSTTDSIDFTKPRIFIVYANDLKGKTEYSVNINVHKEEANTFVWTLVQSDWQPETKSEPTLPPGIKCIIGKSSTELYALSDDNKLLVSLDDGVVWVEDLLDDDASLIPTEDIAMVCYPLFLSEKTDYVLLVGNRSEELYPQENIAMVWRKIVDYDDLAPVPVWAYMERPANSWYQLPRMKDLSLIRYDDGVLAFGAPYTKIYQSRDNGITWKENKSYQMPVGFDTSATSVAVSVDDDNNIWLHCSGTGQVWRGRLNKMGWDTQE